MAETTFFFTDPIVAANYEAIEGVVDQFLDMPIRKPGTCFRGMLSTITPEAAARYVRLGGNLIREKVKAMQPAGTSGQAAPEPAPIVKKAADPYLTDFTKE